MKIKNCVPLLLLADCLVGQSIGTWTRLIPTTSPPACSVGQMIFDAARDRVVLFGGSAAPGLPAVGVWEFDGQTWQVVASPASIGIGASWWDDQRGQIVGLENNLGPLQSNLYGWTGTSWQLLSSAGVMPQRLDEGAWAFDSLRRAAVWFLGNNNRSDTWEWDGVSFQQRSAGGPIPRYMASMVFDRGRSQTLLFGGGPQSGTTGFSDTWTWNGSQWVGRFGVPSPPGRFDAMIACDHVRNRVLMYGGRNGYNATQSTCRADTWEWNGAGWFQPATTGQPPAIANAGLVYDSARRRYVLFGGRGDNDRLYGETWVFEAVDAVVASAVNYGTGCPGPRGVPLLAPAHGDRPVIGQTMSLTLSNLPIALASFPVAAIGFSDQAFAGGSLPSPLDWLVLLGACCWSALTRRWL